MTIPGASSRGTGNVGYPDIVYLQPTEVEIYEIKPRSYQPLGLGEVQLQRYIDQYNAPLSFDEPHARAGISLNAEINTISFSSLFFPGQTIVYHTSSDNPGMVYYEYTGELDPTRQPVPVLPPLPQASPSPDRQAQPYAQRPVLEGAPAWDVSVLDGIPPGLGMGLGLLLVVGAVVFFFDPVPGNEVALLALGLGLIDRFSAASCVPAAG